MDQDSVKLGLLIEAAQTHQRLAEAAIEKLNKQTQGLQAVMRDQVQRALADALKSLRSAKRALSSTEGRAVIEGREGRDERQAMWQRDSST